LAIPQIPAWGPSKSDEKNQLRNPNDRKARIVSPPCFIFLAEPSLPDAESGWIGRPGFVRGDAAQLGGETGLYQ